MKKNPAYSVICHDDNILAVNKSSGISVTQDRWDESKERLDKLLENDFEIPKLFTVHRIDKDTSGIVIFAKTKEAHKNLSMAFEQRSVKKKYTLIIHGRPVWNEISCDLPLVPNGNKKHMTIIDKYKGKESHTHFVCLFRAGNYSVLEAFPQTGRIHQIRVHASSLGHPVVCDTIYGKFSPVKLSSFKRAWKGDPHEEKPLLERLALHASEVTLPCGTVIAAPIAKDMQSLISQLKKISKNN
ncbi:MAG: RNA pseudouridine synthase [Treponema sp.]|nr:RNA pseudouridine synthase [Treponema sp.]